MCKHNIIVWSSGLLRRPILIPGIVFGGLWRVLILHYLFLVGILCKPGRYGVHEDTPPMIH